MSGRTSEKIAHGGCHGKENGALGFQSGRNLSAKSSSPRVPDKVLTPFLSVWPTNALALQYGLVDHSLGQKQNGKGSDSSKISYTIWSWYYIHMVQN